MRTPVRMGILCACVLACAEPGRTQSAKFEEAVKQSRSAIEVRDGKLGGPGAEVLRKALDDAHFVLLGEDHGIKQIPAFATALCGELGPRGFHTLTIETGPAITVELEKFARAPEGAKQFAEFDKKYPFSTCLLYTSPSPRDTR